MTLKQCVLVITKNKQTHVCLIITTINYYLVSFLLRYNYLNPMARRSLRTALLQECEENRVWIPLSKQTTTKKQVRTSRNKEEIITNHYNYSNTVHKCTLECYVICDVYNSYYNTSCENKHAWKNINSWISRSKYTKYKKKNMCSCNQYTVHVLLCWLVYAVQSCCILTSGSGETNTTRSKLSG